MKSLKAIVKILEKYDFNQKLNYAIPKQWNMIQYNDYYDAGNEIIVNPYKFYHNVITEYIFNNKTPLNTKNTNGDWIKKSIVYSAMIRTSSAYNHDRNNLLEEKNFFDLKDYGTFLKFIAYLPSLHQMGIDTLYLLPLMQYSLKDKKGELGSPYGVSNFYKLDPSLSDPMISEMDLNDQFSALIEACHLLGIKVVIDFIPRTNSVNSDYIITNPEWFYWISLDSLNTYHSPHIEGINNTSQFLPKYIKEIYSNENVINHIKQFLDAPNIIDPIKWQKVVDEFNTSDEYALDIIRREFNMTTAPAFSDQINDVQPPWSDVTFFRMYLDHPIKSSKYVDKSIKPYILFDTIKSNVTPGKIINESLWETLENVIVYYQETFNIDGARIDMGHALPTELTKRIISKAKNNNPDFCFIAEELKNENAKLAFEQGYNMIIGEGFQNCMEFENGKMNEFYLESRHLPCPVFAANETHDTRRIITANGGLLMAKLTTTLNMFMPNGIPFINSGQELGEIHPMNTGINCRNNEAYLLPHHDPYHGKLPLFDKYVFHYDNELALEMTNLISKTAAIRKNYIDCLTNLDNFMVLKLDDIQSIGFAYKFNNQALIIIANTNPYIYKRLFIDLSKIRKILNNNNLTAKQLFSTHFEQHLIDWFEKDGNLYFDMGQGEVKVFLL